MSGQKITGPTRKPYKTDLTDEQWELLRGLLPPAAAKSGREPTDLREVLNAILYQDKTGCQWDMLPHDLLPRSTAFGYYKKWQEDGTWERILEVLRAKVRVATPRVVEGQADPTQQPPESAPSQAGRPAEAPPLAEGVPGVAMPPPQVPPATSRREQTPSFTIMDSQSVKTTEVGGEQRGYDGGKKVKGRKRHIAVDTLGMLLAVTVTAANISDGRGACRLLEQLSAEKFPRLEAACGDGRYNDKQFIAALEKRDLRLEVKSRPPGSKGFVLLKKRWIVERTFAWLGVNRRLSKDYERTVKSSETRVRTAAIGLMVRRLTKKAA